MRELNRAHLTRTLATRLSAKAGTWIPDGDTVRGEDVLITVTDLHGGTQEPNHIDIGVSFISADPDLPVLWDCAAGVGRTSKRIAEMAAHMWLETTGNAVLALLTEQEEFAAHIPGDDADGLPGFHVIHSPALLFGGGEMLERWLTDHPLLPALRATLPAHLDEPINGVKLLFGGGRDDETVEVRVNGMVRDDATAAIRDLDWPRDGYVRFYLLAFPEEGD